MTPTIRLEMCPTVGTELQEMCWGANMPAAAKAKQERIQIRLDAQGKKVLQRATGYRHKTLSRFVLDTALEEAERIIQENELVTLSSADWQVFYDALTNSHAPNAALHRAYAGYRKANR